MKSITLVVFIGSGGYLLGVATKWEAGSIVLKGMGRGWDNLDLALLFTTCVTLGRLLKYCDH